MLAQTSMLPADAVDKAGVFRIGSIIFRLAANEIQIKIHFNRMTGNAQIVEVRAQKTDPRNIAVQRVFGMDLGHHAVRGDHVENVHVFNDARAQRIPAPAGLDFLVSRNLRMGAPIGNDRLKPVFRSLLGQVTAIFRNLDEGMGRDELLAWKLDVS